MYFWWFSQHLHIKKDCGGDDDDGGWDVALLLYWHTTDDDDVCKDDYTPLSTQ